MTTNFKTRSDHEAKSLEMIDSFEPSDELYCVCQCVKMVLRARWALSDSAERIHEIAQVLIAAKWSFEHTETILRQMRRKKILRSRRHSGKLLFELNY